MITSDILTTRAEYMDQSRSFKTQLAKLVF